MKSNQTYLIISVFVIFAFFYGAFLWTTKSTLSADGIPSYQNYQAGLLLFLGVLSGMILLHFHPRFGGLHPKYQTLYDYAIFAAAIFMPAILLMLPFVSISSTYRSILVTIGMAVIFLLYISHALLLRILFARKRYALVHRSLDFMQRLRPRNANLYITRGVVLYAQQDFEKAIEAADNAIELTPALKKKPEEGGLNVKDWRLLGAHQLRMLIFFTLDQHEMAFEDAEVLVRLNPKEASSYINRGMASTHREDFAAAEADFDFATQLKPDAVRMAYLLTARADLAYMQHQNEEAQSLFQRALVIPIDANHRRLLHPAIYSVQAFLELREGQLEAAQKFCQKAQSIDPNFTIPAIALIHAQKGEWGEAVAQWQLIIARVPRYADIENLRNRYRSDPDFVYLIEQIMARLEPAAA